MSPEELARQQIDELLANCGWAVQDYKRLNLSAGRGIAVREVPLVGGTADYLLFVDRKPVGVVEAKKAGVTLSGVAEQSGYYADNLPGPLRGQITGTLPFLYESTGVETFFRDERDPHPRSRRVFAFHRPENLAVSVAEPNTLRNPARADAFRAPSGGYWDARLSGGGSHQAGAVLRGGSPPRAHPDGYRFRQDVHRLRGGVPAHQVRQGPARALSRGPRQPGAAGQEGVPRLRHARHRAQVHRALQRPAPHLRRAGRRFPRHDLHHPAALLPLAWRGIARGLGRTLHRRTLRRRWASQGSCLQSRYPHRSVRLHCHRRVPPIHLQSVAGRCSNTSTASSSA